MTTYKIIDFDIIYLSYDEPNAEENYADLLTKVPWAKRVHGVEGSDAAHKACAEISDTYRFVTVDGDNKINPNFLNQVISFQPGVDLSRHVISWTADNLINGLQYGNGGIKCWDKETVLRMKTHENADPGNTAAGIDFCWDLEYVQVSELMSTIHNNATPHQAWRAGFREGVKMCLIEGNKPKAKDLIHNHWKNLERLYVWSTVGADVKNGMWAIYGAREGMYKTMCTDWDYVNVRDFEYLNKIWNDEYSQITEKMLPYEIQGLGETLRFDLDIPIPVVPFDEQQSAFYKTTYKNPARPVHHLISNKLGNVSPAPIEQNDVYDIVMISYNEENADENYEALKKKFPRAQRIHGVKGIHQAHVAAANLCTTEMFWIVDGDAVLESDFNFDYIAKDTKAVHVWRSVNPVNGMQYGYGGLKLFPTQMTRDMDVNTPDMTTSISNRFVKMDVISNTTAFDTSPFNTWKSAFRECCKLSSKVINRQKNDETEERLHIWCNVDLGHKYGSYALAGARAGKDYGEANKDNKDALRKINDFDWLMEKFQHDYPDEKVQKIVSVDAPVIQQPKKIEAVQATRQVVLSDRDNDIVDILDRFEILYGEKLANIRRFYNDGHILDLLKIIGDENLRKYISEKNYHSMFRYLETKGHDVDELRKVFLEKNLHSLFRLLGEDYEDLRKSVTEENLHSIFRLLGDEHEELRKAVTEKNIHSLFRLLGNEFEDLRKAVLEQNLHALFRVIGLDYEELRKAVTDENIHSIFRYLGDNYYDLRQAVVSKNPNDIFKFINGHDDLRKILVSDNEHSLYRLLEKDETVENLKSVAFDNNIWALKKLEPSIKDEVLLAMDNNYDKLWNILEKYTESKLIKPLRTLHTNNVEYDKDCLSRGQLKSKKWLVDRLEKLDEYLGVVFLCAGWYGTIVPMFQERKLKFQKFRNFDIDPSAIQISEIWNKDLVNDDWKFKGTVADIHEIDYENYEFETLKSDGTLIKIVDQPHTIINTSCEHIKDFDKWYAKLPVNKLIVLQSNDYFSIAEHVNCSKDLQEFSESAPMERVLYEGQLELGEYRRFMKIGYK